MTVWQQLNSPRNKRERRVAKIARDQERQRIIELIEDWVDCEELHTTDDLIALIKGEQK